MKKQIAIIGSASIELPSKTIEKAKEIARLLAEKGFTILTGACTGIPDIVAKEAKKHGAKVIGISPAYSLEEHINEWNYPYEYFDAIIFPGNGRARNFVLVNSSDAVLLINGRIGALNEFTAAFDEGKIIAVCEETGGIADHIKEIIDFAGKKARNTIISSSKPKELIELLELELKKEK